MEKRFLINISILQIVPALSVGVLFAGIGMFLYLFLTTKRKTHLAMFLLSVLAFVFVSSELLVVMFGMVFNNTALSVQFHRLEQICGAYFLFILPYFLLHYLDIGPRINSVSSWVSFVGLFFAFAVTIVAFLAPDLFVSITEVRRPHWLIDVRGMRRGQEGALYHVRDVLLGIEMVYIILLLVLHIIKKKSIRYVTSILTGVIVGIYFAAEDILHVYLERHIDFCKNIEGARFPVGVSVFVFCSMIAVFRRFVDRDNELNLAYQKLSLSRRKADLLNESLEISLKEKEVLLKEIHHRVKNNLQIVASLLYLQSEKIEKKKIQQYFLESQNRISTMALIHEHLYLEETLGEIDLESYLKELVVIIIETYQGTNNTVCSSVSVPRLQFPLQSAVPLGLIVNELVTNAIIHGLAGKEKGIIRIELHHQDAWYVLRIEDNGKGLPATFDIVRDGSLGLSLVSSLCTQMKATFSLFNEGGTVAVLRFQL